LKSSCSHNGGSGRFSRILLTASLVLFALQAFSCPAAAARVLIVGDLQYALVADVAADIRAVIRTQVKEYASAEVRGRLSSVVEREGAQVVVALGMDAVAEALRLPPGVTVVYGLVVSPPKSSRSNLTGVYMSPPVSEYLTVVRRYFPTLGRISVLGSPTMIRSLAPGNYAQVTTYPVAGASELVSTMNRLTDSQALLLLPDVNLLTSSAMENIYAFSYRKNVPLLGISEGNVRQGSLLALVFDPKSTGWQIGEKVQSILNGEEADEHPPSPPKKYNLFLNTNTARKMGIGMPAELLKKAKKIYP
jgi:putative tryptophan/tyrosine transport system substrate-binding protein